MTSVALAMLAIAFTIVGLALSLAGVGLALRRAYGLEQLSVDDCFVAFWTGFGLTLLFLIVWNFALPIGTTPLLIVIATGAAGLFASRRPLRTLVRQWRSELRFWPAIVLALGVLWIVNHSMVGFASWDGVLYHVQAVKWAKSFAVIPGIANLHGPLAFNNSSFLYDAMVDSGWWEGRGFHIANGVLLLGATVQALVSGFQWLGATDQSSGRRCFGFVMLALVLHLGGDAGTYSTDLPLGLMLGAAATLLYGLLDGSRSTGGRASDGFDIVALTTILAAAVSIKLTAVVFACVALPLALVSEFSSWRSQQPHLTRSLTWGTAIIVVFAAAWTIRGVVMSGYPFFPLPVAGMPVDWRAPIEHANLEMAYIAHTEREFTWRMIGSNWVRSILLLDVNAALVPGVLSAMALLIGRRSRRHGRKGIRTRHTWWLAMPVFVAIAVWLMTAPSHRYSPALFWSLAALCIAECQRMTWPALTAGGRRWAVRLVAGVAVSPLFVQPIVNAVREQRSPLTPIARNIVKWRFDDPLAPLGGEVGVKSFRTRSGAELNVPLEAKNRDNFPNGCWNAPLPCTPNPAPNLQLRTPGNLAGGFVVSGAWEMENWPYWWHAYFLPEWRSRNGGS